jgi:virginiamycin B lyase
MTSIPSRLLNLFFCTFVIAGVAEAAPGAFSFSTITFTGATNTVAYGVNNNGQIVGSENASNGTPNGFLSSGGTTTTFNFPPGSMAGSYAEGINNSGQIVGQNLTTGAGFFLSGGTPTAIAVPGADNGTTNAIGINNSGQIVGSFLKGGVQFGFLMNNGVYTTVAPPGATATVASGINNTGQIVGWFTSNGVTSGFLLSGGTYSTLMIPGSTSTKAIGLNNSGQIVGQYTSGGTTSGFLSLGGNYTVIDYVAINVPNSVNTSAIGINDAGQIVGSYVIGGTVFGFSAAQTTVPVSLNQYPATFPANSPSPITAGPDGALWFVIGYGGGFGRITTLGTVTEYGSTALTGGGITAGPDGALWFGLDGRCFIGAGCGPGNIGRITTAGVITEFAAPAGRPEPQGIVAGPDGALWYADNGNSQIGRITTSGVSTVFPLSQQSADPIGIAVGPDGALWFTEQPNGNAQIGRITTAGAITEFPPLSGGAVGPIGIVAGPDGALWFTENGGNQIGRITTSGTVTEYPVPTPGAGPAQIVAGADGALWFIEASVNKIGRITTSGAITEYLAPEVSGISPGPDGGIWFTEPLTGYIGELFNTTNATPALLSITKTHTGNFTQGQTNQTYTVTVSNEGGAQSTTGTVTVTETLPPGLSLASMAGTGWNCTANTCSRGESLPGGYSYPPITVTVNVAANAASPQVNQVSVQGGGSAAASASDSTTIVQLAPALSVTKTHTGNFAPGQTNATYSIVVSNTGLGPTNGAVTVTDTLPSGLTLVSMVGIPPCNLTTCNGWTCTLNSCMRSDGLAPGASYPAIIVTVNVAANAASPQVNAVSVSGGGSAPAAATDSTIIGATHPPFFNGEVSLGSGVYYLTFPDNNLFGAYTYLPGSFIYHYDMGFEYVSPANDAGGDVYFYDFTSGHWWYTGPALFPNLYDFTLAAWIYYFPDTSNPGHYTTNPRKFAYDTTHVIFTM